MKRKRVSDHDPQTFHSESEVDCSNYSTCKRVCSKMATMRRWPLLKLLTKGRPSDQDTSLNLSETLCLHRTNGHIALVTLLWENVCSIYATPRRIEVSM